MLTIFTIPSATEIVSSSTAYSQDFFTEFLPVIYVAVGVLIFSLGVRWLVGVLKGGMKGAFGKRGGKRRGRR